MNERDTVEVVTKRQTAPRRTAVLPRLAAASRQGWQAAADTWRHYPTDGPAADVRLPAPLAALGQRTAPLRQRLATRRVRRGLVAGLLVCVLVIVSCGLLNLSTALTAVAAARDAKAQVAAIQATLSGGGATDAAHLRQVQQHLDALAADIQHLQAAIPAQSVTGSAPGTAGMVHLVRMASDLVQAGQAAMPAAIVLAPHLKELMASLQSSGDTTTGTTGTTTTPPPSTPSASQTPPPPPLTVASVQQAGAALDRALPYLQAALVERTHVSDADLRLIGAGKYLPLLHELDAYLPYTPKLIATLHAVAGALPTLLGVGQPTNFLLFNLDSDELRPTGGFIGNYALITLDGGKMTSGVHLHDIYSLDCPQGPALCPEREIPSQDAWMTINPHHWALRDSNTDPDYPTSARVAEQLLAQEGNGTASQGVISITPRVIEQLLQATGPITITSYCAMVSAQNLRDVIHYFHMSTTLGITTWCPGPQTQSSNRKAFDAELGSTLLHRVAILPSAQQKTLVKSLLDDFATRDIQLYFNDPGLEAALTSFGLDGAVQAPRGDSLFLVDTNTGANYANGDVREQISDRVTLDAHGTATHDLTLTYTYPKTSHLYTDVYEANRGYWTYQDALRVLVPARAHLIGQDGCTPFSSTEPAHAAWGCTILFGQPNSVTMHFHWSVPGAASVAGGTLHYSLLLQHQAGTRNAVDVTISAPSGYQLAATPQAPLTRSGNAQAHYAATLAVDQTLDVSFRS